MSSRTTTRGTDRAVHVVRAVYEAFDRGDRQALLTLVAPHVTVHQSPTLPWGGTYRGHAGLGHFLGALSAHLDSRPGIEQLVVDGAGHVVQVGRTRGTVRATGVAFDVAEVHVWTVTDGLVERFEAYLDGAAMAAALAGDARPGEAEPDPSGAGDRLAG